MVNGFYFYDWWILDHVLEFERDSPYVCQNQDIKKAALSGSLISKIQKLIIHSEFIINKISQSIVDPINSFDKYFLQ